MDESGAPVTTLGFAAAPVAARKNWFLRHKVLTGLGALMLVGIASTAAGASDTTTPTNSEAGSASPGASTPASQPSNAPVATGATKAKPAAAPAPAPAKPPAPTVFKYAGRGNKILSIKKPGTGPALISFTHAGSANFIVSQLDQSLQETDGLVNEIGRYSGTTILDAEDGSESPRIKIEADGQWTVKIQPLTSARRMGSSASGKGDAVLAYAGPAGVATLTHKGSANFIVEFFNSEGVNGLVNEIGRYSGESVIGAGPGVLQIHADGAWTVKVS